MVIVLLHITLSILGINWGLPSRSIDNYLFGSEQPWSGEKIYRLANAADKFSASRGADVDADPFITGSSQEKTTTAEDRQPIPLTSTPEDVAKIYLRYRLFTYQPDEMITMMALAGMKPSQWNFDPRLYQYGGLFIYPVGALIKLCGMLGLIDVRSDVVYYLDHPDEFGKFYIVARAYSAAWGAIGVVVVFAITRRLANKWHVAQDHVDGAGTSPHAGARIPSRTNSHSRILSRPSTAGLLAAFLFTLMPVVVCMAHEGKPHLPGAVLMLIAVWLAMLCIETKRLSHFLYMCVTCGAAVGMVLSSWPICILIPLIAWMNRTKPVACAPGSDTSFARAKGSVTDPKSTKVHWPASFAKGTLIAIATYLITNPYIVINTFTNREVLRSNFGNSFAMYQVSRIGEGFIRVLQLTAEGATWPILILGSIAFITVVWQLARNNRHRATILQTEPPAQAEDASEPGAHATVHSRAATDRTAIVTPTNDLTLALPLLVVAMLFLLQFVLIGAGKPAEYGRFGIFTNTALTIATATMLFKLLPRRISPFIIIFVFPLVLLCTLTKGTWYCASFVRDADSRLRWHFADEMSKYVGESLKDHDLVYVVAEPAPYACPPLEFHKLDVRLAPKLNTFRDPIVHKYQPRLFIKMIDDPLRDRLAKAYAQDSSAPGSEKLEGGSTSGHVENYHYQLAWPTQIAWANKPILWVLFHWHAIPSEQ